MALWPSGSSTPSIKRGHKVFFCCCCGSKIMQNFYSHINLNLTCKKISIKADSTLSHFKIFHFYPFCQRTSENGMKISQMSSFICKIANFSFHKILKTFSWKEKFSVCFFFIFGVRSWSRNSWKFKRQFK